MAHHDVSAFGNPDRPWNREPGCLQGLAQRLDHDALRKADVGPEQVQRETDLDAAQQPRHAMIYAGEPGPAGPAVDAPDRRVQPGDLAQRRPAEAVGQPHDPALDQARQPEPLRSDEPGGAQRRQAQPRAHVSRHPAVTDQEHEQAQPEQGEADLRHHLYREVPDRAGHGRS